jgi:hypothetical protein
MFLHGSFQFSLHHLGTFGVRVPLKGHPLVDPSIRAPPRGYPYNLSTHKPSLGSLLVSFYPTASPRLGGGWPGPNTRTLLLTHLRCRKGEKIGQHKISGPNPVDDSISPLSSIPTKNHPSSSRTSQPEICCASSVLCT